MKVVVKTAPRRRSSVPERVLRRIKSGEIVYGTNTDVSALKSAPTPGSTAQAAGYAVRWDRYVEHYDKRLAGLPGSSGSMGLPGGPLWSHGTWSSR